MGQSALPAAALEALQIELAGERSLDRLLSTITRRLAELPGTALARLWLVRRDAECEICRGSLGAESGVPCLHLVSSAGRSRSPGADWGRLNGAFHRFPIGGRKVGRVAATGQPLVANDLASDPDALQHPEWARSERLVAFGGQPLRFRDEVLGVLGLFLRVPFDEDDLARLRTIADHAAATLATARAFEEAERLRAQLEVQNAILRDEVREVAAFGSILGESPALRRVLDQVALVAESDATVVVRGESGTGKELVAREIHARSARAEGPWVRVNCAAIPSELFESEFFGHVRGAFTGATRDRIGFVAAADGGTLFLDEVGEIPLALQAKLLRVLEQGEVQRLGETKVTRADVRVVAATNRDLEAQVRSGGFREDLYYRLNVFPIEMPPLRDRAGDAAILARHFFERVRHGEAVYLSPENLAELADYDWPGNVRELRNVIERAAIVTRSGPLALQLGPKRRRPQPGVLREEDLQALMRDNLMRALEETGGRIYGPDGAAALLGLKPTTLRSRLEKYGIDPKRSSRAPDASL
ncbi:MAG: sigma 54-interacting transcriptional regulator [Myxococcota bacterium]